MTVVTPMTSASTPPSAIASVIAPNTSANRKPTTRPISCRRRPLLEQRLARDDEDHVRDADAERDSRWTTPRLPDSAMTS